MAGLLRTLQFMLYGSKHFGSELNSSTVAGSSLAVVK